MGSGILVMSGGLKGTQPVHISPGGSSVSFVATPDVPRIKRISSGTLLGNARLNFDDVLNPPFYVITTNTLAINNTGTFNYTANGGQAGRIGAQSGANSGWLGTYYVFSRIAAAGDYIATNTDASSNVSITVNQTVNSYTKIDHGTAPTQITIKQSAGDLANPETTDFAGWGTELSAADYDKVYDVDDGLSINYAYITAKITGINQTSWIFPAVRGTFSSNGLCYVWNFTTSAWDTIYASSTNSAGTGGGVQYHILGKPFAWTADYVENGVCYIKTKTCVLAYIGFIGYEPFINC